MRYQFLLLAFLFLFIDVKSQFITSSDTILCYGEDVTLIASGANISSSFINTDDVHSEVIDIGFNFNFYGNVYNQCVLSANGYITFDLSQSGLYSPWISIIQMLDNYLKMQLWHLGMILILV